LFGTIDQFGKGSITNHAGRSQRWDEDPCEKRSQRTSVRRNRDARTVREEDGDVRIEHKTPGSGTIEKDVVDSEDEEK
jgi:hypothetical protein